MLEQLNLAATPRLVDFPFQVCEIGIARGHLQERHVFCYEDKIEICLRLASKAELAEDIIDGKKYLTPFPHLVTKLPRSKHIFSAKDPREAFFFCYPEPLLEQIRKTNLLPEAPLQKIELSPELNALLRQFSDLMPHSQEYGIADRIDILCFQVLEELMIMRKKTGAGADLYRDRILQIASYLKLYFANDIDIDELAKTYGFSRRSLFRHWARHFDVSPAEYILNLKMEEAKRLLRDTRQNVCAISAHLNFSEANYFCSVFRKYYGTTPRSYRLLNSIWDLQE